MNKSESKINVRNLVVTLWCLIQLCQKKQENRVKKWSRKEKKM